MRPIVASVLIAVGIVFAAYFVFGQFGSTGDASRYKRYVDAKHGFSFEFPGNWKLKPLYGGDGVETPIVYADSTKCGFMSGCRTIAGVGEFHVGIIDRPIELTATVSGPALTKETVNGKVVYFLPRTAGIEDTVQSAYVGLNGKTVLLSASGIRIDALRRIAGSIAVVQQACTQEAKVCPDGSSVGRTGLNCEFTECPSTDTNAAVTRSNTNSTDTTNVNRTPSASLRVVVVNAQTAALIADRDVQLYSDNGVRCVTEPCPTNGRTWNGTTDTKGMALVPTSMVDESMTFTVDGYLGAELHTGGTLQGDGSWTLPLRAM